jgi:hypothetical protein
MTAYRFLWLDEKGHVPRSTHVECATDQQAIELAGRQTGDYEAIEIWDGPRFVHHRANLGRPGSTNTPCPQSR